MRPSSLEAPDNALNGFRFEERPYFDASYPDLFGGELASRLCTGPQLRFLENCVLREFTEPAILDHGCGFGLWTSALESRGWKLTGLDQNAVFLDHARQRRGVRGELVEGDAREFRRPGAFDVILSLGGTWGSFERTDAAGILANLRDSLRPGGTALFQLVNPRFVQLYQPDRWWYRGSGDLLVLERQDLSEPGYCRLEQLRMRPGDCGIHRTRQVYYGQEEMAALLEGAGFTILHTWGGMDGSMVADSSRDLVFHCRRA